MEIKEDVEKEDFVGDTFSYETAGVNVEKVAENESGSGAVKAWHGGKIRDALFGKLPIMVVIFHRLNKDIELRYARIRYPLRISGKEYYYSADAIEHYGAFACVSIYENDPNAYYPAGDPTLDQETLRKVMQLEILNRAKLQARKQSKYDYVMQYVLIAIIVIEGVLLWLR
jgi:hypothetical protein